MRRLRRFIRRHQAKAVIGFTILLVGLLIGHKQIERIFIPAPKTQAPQVKVEPHKKGVAVSNGNHNSPSGLPSPPSGGHTPAPQTPSAPNPSVPAAPGGGSTPTPSHPIKDTVKDVLDGTQQTVDGVQNTVNGTTCNLHLTCP